MSVGKLTDEQRHERALALDEIAEKIKTEYGDALAVLGCLPVIQRDWGYTVADHVERALSHGVVLNPRGQEIQRDYLDLLRTASITELSVVVRILAALLEVDRLNIPHRNIVHEVINVLVFAEGMLENKKSRYDKEHSGDDNPAT